MAEEVMQSLEVKHLILGDVSTMDTATPKAGQIGISGGALLVSLDGSIWTTLA